MAKVEKIDGANLWTKTCPHCKKEFKTFSRKQKFCCVEHGMKYNKRIKTSRKKYDVACLISGNLSVAFT